MEVWNRGGSEQRWSGTETTRRTTSLTGPLRKDTHVNHWLQTPSCDQLHPPSSEQDKRVIRRIHFYLPKPSPARASPTKMTLRNLTNHFVGCGACQHTKEPFGQNLEHLCPLGEHRI